MASQRSENIITPAARMVMGNLYSPRTTNYEGQPLVYKTGPNAGKPRPDYFFAIAIPKGQEVSGQYGALNWAMTPWGAEIYKAGCAFLAHAASLPSFSWKVADGDSRVPNKEGNILAEREGCAGHWILYFGGTVPPQLCTNNGAQKLTEPDEIVAGYWVQVAFNAKGNDSTGNPGVFLNAAAVERLGFDKKISTGVNTATVGFGNVALPPGVSATPLATLNAGGLPPAAAQPGAAPINFAALNPAAAAAPAAQQPPPLPAGPAALALPAVQPNAAFLQLPAALKPTAAAQGQTLEAWKAAGHTEEALIAAGVFVR